MVAIPLPFLLSLHLRRLAVRVRDAALAEYCIITGVGASAALTCIGFALWLSKQDGFELAGTQTAQRQFFFLVLLVTMTASSLFLLWWLYVFAAFTRAFHRAARIARQQLRQSSQVQNSS